MKQAVLGVLSGFSLWCLFMMVVVLVAASNSWSSHMARKSAYVPQVVTSGVIDVYALTSFIRNYQSGLCKNNERLLVEDVRSRKQYLVCLDQVKK
jgi:hypothetical protein